MGKLRDRMEQDLRLGGYSPATQRIYLLYAREFARYYMRSPADMGEEEIRAYLMHRIERKCSHAAHAAICAGRQAQTQNSSRHRGNPGLRACGGSARAQTRES